MKNDERGRNGAWWMTALGLALALVTMMSGCAFDGEAWTGRPLGGNLKLHSAKEGVYPDKSVLTDPRNPFAVGSLPQDTVWEIEAAGDPVVAFYAWATATARGATGERQYYTALNLKRVFDLGMADEGDMPIMKDQAIAAFQSMLYNFPDAVTYASNGIDFWDLATPAVQAIIDLGGKPAGGWILVTVEGGGVKAVRQ